MDNSNLLNDFYKNRENYISTLEENDKKNLESLLLERKDINKKLEIAISNIPDGFVEVINNIRTSIEDKLDIENDINGYFNEKSYKVGFSDAIKLMMDCKNYENNNEY